jgi:hypothetical protein
MPCQPATPITQVSDAGRLLEPHRLPLPRRKFMLAVRFNAVKLET